MPRILNLTGMVVGDLTVLQFDTEKSKNSRKRFWLCRCKCGNIRSYSTDVLTSKKYRSCGCRQYEGNHKTHGKANTRIYAIWSKMKSRCHTPSTPHYEYYGGKGITVCDEWNSSFEAFYEWAINNGYSDSLSIDRIDPSKGYCPDNCRWVTKLQQARNKENSVMIKIGDKIMPSSYYADLYKIPTRTISSRYRSMIKRRIIVTEDNLCYPAHKKPDKVPVNQYSLNGEFLRRWDSYADVEKSGVGKRTGVRMCCLGKWKSAYGFIWRLA